MKNAPEVPAAIVSGALAERRILQAGHHAANRVVDDVVERDGLRAARHQPHLQMILQIVADALRIEHHLDAVALQQIRRPDAGELQQLRRITGCCALCGGSNSELRFLDFQLYVDLYGQVYFDEGCAQEFITALDGFSSVEAKVIELQMEEARSIIADLVKRNEGLENDLNAIRRVISITSTASLNPNNSGVPLSFTASEESSGGTDEFTLQPALFGDSEDAEPVESVKKSRPQVTTIFESSDPTGLDL